MGLVYGNVWVSKQQDIAQSITQPPSARLLPPVHPVRQVSDAHAAAQLHNVKENDSLDQTTYFHCAMVLQLHTQQAAMR